MACTRLIHLLASLLLLSLALPANAGTRPAPPMLNITAGAVGIADSLERPTRFGLEFRFRDQTRFRLIPAIGIALFHLSNGGLADENPGTEALVASICIPLGRPRPARE